MNPDRHARIKEVFLEACALSPSDRLPLVAKRCAGDESLRREVERLLLHYRPDVNADAVPDVPGGDPPAEKPSNTSTFPTYQTGSMVAGRYRIVALLGEGAMGRVYRAEDMQLRQEVALKFLPRLHILDRSYRNRIEREVKLAREVGHPNICRVYDLGEADGVSFLSMEYVDGEDLGSLLRRVGRLTGERAVEIARQLCAGLAAAHIHGVLHRDLKPANIMINHQGRVKITDFGLAVFAGHVQQAEIRAGTPRYMAPEQLSGVSVDEKSDIYSLGLVLFEMFTGKPAFSANSPIEYLHFHQSVEAPLPSLLVPEIDPQVEAVIMACLRKDPAERPASAALNVAAALPGGDLLAAALAAGQIPTREMLAASAATGTTNRRGMRQVAAAALLLLIAAQFLGNDTHPVARQGGVKSPDFLLEKAREVLRDSRTRTMSKSVDARFFPVADADFSALISLPLAAGVQPAFSPDEKLCFRYCENVVGATSRTKNVLSFVMPSADPFQFKSDSSTTVILDGHGRLIYFASNAPPEEGAASAGLTETAHSLIRASGYSPESLVPTKPITIPETYADEQVAFFVPARDGTNRNLRIEIAGIRGQARFFCILRDAAAPPESARVTGQAVWTLIKTARNTLLLLLLIAAIPAAWKNLRADGDVAGALGIGGFVLGLRLLSLSATFQNLGSFSENIDNVVGSAAGALAEALIVAIFYVAMESHVRRWWPRSLGSWSRILAGRFRDPFVGRDILIGCLIGVFWANLLFLDRQLPQWLNWESRMQLRLYQGLDDILSPRYAFAGVFDSLRIGIYQGLTVLLILVIATGLAGQRRWLGFSVAWLVAAAMYAPAGSHPLTVWTLFALGGVAVALYALIHWGLVTLVAALLVVGLLGAFPLTTSFSAWYAGYGLFAVAATFGLLGWSLYESNRPCDPAEQFTLRFSVPPNRVSRSGTPIHP